MSISLEVKCSMTRSVRLSFGLSVSHNLKGLNGGFTSNLLSGHLFPIPAHESIIKIYAKIHNGKNTNCLSKLSQKTRAKTTFYRGLPGAEADDGHLEAVAHLYQGGHLALKVET